MSNSPQFEHFGEWSNEMSHNKTGSSKLDLCTTFVSAYILLVRSRVLWLIQVLLVRRSVKSTGTASRLYKIMQI